MIRMGEKRELPENLGLELDYREIHSELERRMACNTLYSAYATRREAGDVARTPAVMSGDYELLGSLREECAGRLISHLSGWIVDLEETSERLEIKLSVKGGEMDSFMLRKRARQYLLHAVAAEVLAPQFPQLSQRAQERGIRSLSAIVSALCRLEQRERYN